MTVQWNLTCVRCDNILPHYPYYPKTPLCLLTPPRIDHPRAQAEKKYDVSDSRRKNDNKIPCHRHRSCRQLRQPNYARALIDHNKNNDGKYNNNMLARVTCTQTQSIRAHFSIPLDRKRVCAPHGWYLHTNIQQQCTLAPQHVYVLCLRIAQKGVTHYRN
jgi:hypothetical protein